MRKPSFVQRNEIAGRIAGGAIFVLELVILAVGAMIFGVVAVVCAGIAKLRRQFRPQRQ